MVVAFAVLALFEFELLIDELRMLLFFELLAETLLNIPVPLCDSVLLAPVLF